MLPGDVSPGAVQAALYAQGLRYFSASSEPMDRWIERSSRRLGSNREQTPGFQWVVGDLSLFPVFFLLVCVANPV